MTTRKNDMTMTTNDDDNLVDVQEEWTETAGGYCKIDIDIDSDIIVDLVNLWARTNLHEASLEMYTEMTESGADQDAALHAAVANDMIIESLSEQIKRAEEALNDTDNV